MKLTNRLFRCLLFLIISFFVIESKAQSDNSKDHQQLYHEIMRLDSLMFDVAFNKCQFEVWESLMNKEFEFYDDRQGLNTSYATEVESFKNRCSKDFKVTRKLVHTEIFPLNKYGAVQLGVHQFYVDGKLEEIARFVHIWQKSDDHWTITRIVSYDHKPAR